MATAETHKSGGIGKDLVVYVCLLALAGLQFLIAAEHINADADVRPHAGRRRYRRRRGAFVFHASFREPRTALVRPDLHRGCAAWYAIRMDRQFSPD